MNDQRRQRGVEAAAEALRYKEWGNLKGPNDVPGMWVFLAEAAISAYEKALAEGGDSEPKGEVWQSSTPQPAHCNHLSDDATKDPSRAGVHEPHAWRDWAINQNNEYWCDGSLSCGYFEECAVHCNHEMKDGCPPRIPDPTIVTLEQAQFWIGILNRRSIHDLKRIVDLTERVRVLERRRWWKRFSR